MQRETAAILLAAGASTRMGQSKQLLELEGESLVRGSARRLLEISDAPPIVVVGCEADRVVAELAGLDLHCVVNRAWESGIASSLAAGILAAERQVPACAGILVTLADQPFVPTSHLCALVEVFRRGEDAVATSFGTGFGVPAVFARSHFSALRRLEGDSGAKQLLASLDPRSLPCAAAAHDIDTPGEYAAAKTRFGNEARG